MKTLLQKRMVSFLLVAAAFTCLATVAKAQCEVTGSQTVTLCSGLSIIVGNNIYFETGIYTDTLISDAGCDSILTTDLTIEPAVRGLQTLSLCEGETVTVGNSTYDETGVYVDTVYTDEGCDSVVTTDLTIIPAMDGFQSLVLCAGMSVTVGSHTYDETGIYLDTLTAESGCDSLVVTDLTVNDVIDVSTTVDETSITANEAADSYQWIDCDDGNAIIVDETNQSFVPAVSGNYAVILSVNGCVDTSDCVNFTVLGLRNIASNYASIYPNPGNGKFVMDIKSNNLPGSHSIKVFDSTGRTVYMLEASGKLKYEIDLSDRAKGIYFLQLNDGEKVYSQKLVIE